MSKTPCPGCGVPTSTLHSGGDAKIEEPGLCSQCEPQFVFAYKAQNAPKQGRKLGSYFGDHGIAAPAPPAATNGGAK